jgi:hypothetical protein
MMTGTPLGFEIGTGQPVSIPLKHLAITGQTQEAGKTTALEALISRAGLRAITFITKRGEGSFAGARRIAPYFREQADWQFVASILEASRGEKLRFERAWIIRASKGARTLADVQRNVRKAMESAKGMSADVYLTLDAYLDVVVPQIGQVRWAQKVDLAPGVNAMDLTQLSVEMQHLVIKSTLDWVLQHEHDTAVVVPEAWKFIPQGRGTPVKLAAEGFIRQAAALRNFLWLDSQDIAGIEKIILKSVPLWILGVQREANEIKRTLDNIPAGVAKPSRADIATLEIGQFFVCWGRHCLKTYVQPAWLGADEAMAVAATPRAPLPARPPHPRPAPRAEGEAMSAGILHFGNTAVPWTVGWSGEESFFVGPCRFADGRPAICQAEAPGVGKPSFGKPHCQRQRQCIAEGRCDLCGKPLKLSTKVSLSHARPVGHGAEGLAILQVEPLLHKACAATSMQHCPSLKRDIAAGTLRVRQVTRYRVQFAVMGPQYVSAYVPDYVAKSSDRIIGAAKVELLQWIDRDADWLGEG